AKKLYEHKYGKDSETGLPKSVLKGLYFQNSESSFHEALSSGDVYVMHSEDGVEFFGFRKIEAGSQLISPTAWRTCWSSFNWKKTDSKSMVEGEKLPLSVLKLLTQAITGADYKGSCTPR
ncbi:unnamed protein product, partial [Durusdinium trenchii]